MILQIEQVTNGFILYDDSGNKTLYEVDDPNELEGVVNMLYEILVQLGFYGSKHDEKRIRISIEPAKQDQ